MEYETEQRGYDGKRLPALQIACDALADGLLTSDA
jgi:hypothetical protein